MKRVNLKSILFLTISIAIFFAGFYFSSNRMHSVKAITTNDLVSNQKNTLQEHAVKQKLVNDFEDAFIKQYTPLLGCEDVFSDKQKPNCRKHLEQAKNDFKKEFIRNRGLPKNTFEELKLSLVD